MCQKDFEYEDKRLKEYEAFANRNITKDETVLGYRDMNSRFLDAEKLEFRGSLRQEEYNKRKTEHEKRKKDIESAWHKNTKNRVKDLKKGNRGNVKSPDYYQRYSLKELEYFLKNNDRGGNSAEYNSVATDLELYNRIAVGDKEVEGLGLLERLKESCQHYIDSRNPTFTSGKIRKAIITQLSIKVNAEIEKQRNEYSTKPNETLEEMRKEQSDENIVAAFKSHYNLMYQVLNGNMTLKKDEKAKLDSNMEEVLKNMMKLKVDENQSNTLSSRFFNSLGWASNKPTMVDDKDLDDDGKEYKNSPLKKRMYHTTNPMLIPVLDPKTKKPRIDPKTKKPVMKRKENAFEETNQLLGKNGGKVYYGIGKAGKGIYCAVKSNAEGSTDEDAKKDSLSYGKDSGAVMVKMMLNGNARIVHILDAQNKASALRKSFQKIYNVLENTDGRSGVGFDDALTMHVALYGYNTILSNGSFNTNNTVTSDRKALSISTTTIVRDEFGDLDKMSVNNLI